MSGQANGVVQSMTGFASASEPGSGRWSWEARSVNGKGLDIRHRGPAGMERLEPIVRERVSSRFTRGSFQLTLSIESGSSSSKVKINREALAELVDAVREMRGGSDSAPVAVEPLMTVRGIVDFVDEAPGVDSEAEQGIIASLETALDALLEMRASEGAAIADILRGRLDEILALVEKADANEARRPEAIRVRLVEQLAELTEAAPALDPQRLHQEAALLATRADIGEELDRLNAHVDAARALLAGGGAIGRRLDFLAQEFNRETNTLCSKANHQSLTAIGLDLKAVVDQFREQVQNLE